MSRVEGMYDTTKPAAHVYRLDSVGDEPQLVSLVCDGRKCQILVDENDPLAWALIDQLQPVTYFIGTGYGYQVEVVDRNYPAAFRFAYDGRMIAYNVAGERRQERITVVCYDPCAPIRSDLCRY